MLFSRGKTFIVMEIKLNLTGFITPTAFFRSGNRRDKLGWTTARDNLLGWLPAFVQFPMMKWIAIWRIKNRLLKEGKRHHTPLRSAKIGRIPIHHSKDILSVQPKQRIRDTILRTVCSSSAARSLQRRAEKMIFLASCWVTASRPSILLIL